MIEDMGFESYFLIVWDFVKYAKDNGIAVGPGRGSAAGSIVSYVLRITDVDPLDMDLLFERFLNAERKTMPDIDIDFSIRGRERVIRYVQDKYGRDAVAQIITFGKMKPRAATRDAARVLGVDYATGDRLAKLIPEPIMGRSPSFDECMAPGTELRKAYDTEPQAQQVVDVARGLEDIVRNNSIHAAAVVIADRPLTEIVPLQLAEDRGVVEVADPENGNGGKPERVYKTVTQYSMKPIEEIGLLKMDFLGLRTLDVLENAVAIIERSGGERIDLTTLPLDDRKTYEMLARGDSVGVFQLESEGMQEALREVGPTEFDDIVALVALYRPGPMRFIKDYARGKRDPATVRYIDERLKAITEHTYGIAVYQEQLMQIARDIAGFPGPKADTLRRAIGKKKRALMATLKQDFVEGCREGGTNTSVANQLWGLMESAADYSFNRSHAACYGLIAYRTAYLKSNYPAEYMAALISSVMSTKDKVPFFVSRCEEMGNQRAAARREHVRARLRRRRGRHQVRPRCGQERRLRGRREDPRGARGGRGVHLDLGLLRTRRLPHGQQEGDREPDQVRRARLDRGHAQGDAVGAAPGPGRGREGAGGRALGPGIDLRPRSGRRRVCDQHLHRALPAVAGRGVRARRAARDGEGDARHLPLQPSAGRGAPPAARAHRLLARRTSRRSRTAHG